MKKRGRNLFWGVFLLLAAVVVVVGQIIGFAQLGFWSILCGVLLAAVLVESAVKRNITLSLLALALLYVVFQKPLQFFYISPWLLILSALLAGIGLSLIIRPKRRWAHPGHPHAQPDNTDNIDNMLFVEHGGVDDNHPEVSVSFGASSRYLHSTALERALLCSSFGALEVYFDQATLAPGGADLVLDCSFGSIQLFIPRHWRVRDNVAVSLGSLELHAGRARPEADAPELRIGGTVSLGSVEVTYV